MKIRALIEHLQTLDPELDVVLSDENGNDFLPLNSIGGGLWDNEASAFSQYVDLGNDADETIIPQEGWSAVVFYP